MSKQKREGATGQVPPGVREYRARPAGPMRFAMPAGMLLLVASSAILLYDSRTFHRDITQKLAKIDKDMGDLSAKVVAAAKQAPQPARGPDPNKVYTVKTEGSPARGKAGAPILIAEFSDFQ